MNKRNTFIGFLFLFILIFYSMVKSQVGTLWTKTFGGGVDEWGYSVQQTTDGGYIIAGTYLIKTNANGDTLWTKSFGGHSVQQTTDGGYIIAGTYLIKTNTDGDTLWTKPFGGNSVQQTTDEGYIIAGTGLIKTNAVGDTLWTKPFGGNSVQQTTDEGFIIAGTKYSVGVSAYDILLIKTNTNGDTLWTKTFGGSGNDFGKSVQETTDGGYIIVGDTYSGGTIFKDIWLIKTNADGDTLWTKLFGGSGGDEGNSVRQTTDEGYIIVGRTESFGAVNEDVLLIKTNSSGDTLWTKRFDIGDWDRGNSVQETTDEGYIIVGNTMSYITGTNWNVLLIKTSPDVSKIEQNDENIILDYFLKQNYPNPFNSSTTISYRIKESGQTRIQLFDLRGKEISVMLDQYQLQGDYYFQWDARDLASGIYFYSLFINDKPVATKKTVVIK